MPKVENTPVCPFCQTNKHVVLSTGNTFNKKGVRETVPDHMLCEGCGAIQAENGGWNLHCKQCGCNPPKLVGLFVPHLCESCLAIELESERSAGHVCGMCGQPYGNCCC